MYDTFTIPLKYFFLEIWRVFLPLPHMYTHRYNNINTLLEDHKFINNYKYQISVLYMLCVYYIL